METIKTEIGKYLNACRFQKNLNEKTIKAYRIDLRQFSDFLQERGGTLSKAILIEYVEMLNQTFKPKSVKRKMAALKAFFRYLEEEEIFPNNPFRRLKLHIHQPKTLPRVVPLHLIEAMLRVAYAEISGTDGDDCKTAIRDAAVIEMLFATGVRVSELCGLNVKDVDLTRACIMVWGKGAKERLLYIGNMEVLNALKQYLGLSERSADSPLFLNQRGSRLSEQSVRIILKKYEQKAHLTLHVTPHMFRHSFATLLLEEGVDIRYIQKMLGHSSILTTQIYTDVATAKQREILTQKHPRNQFHM